MLLRTCVALQFAFVPCCVASSIMTRGKGGHFYDDDDLDDGYDDYDDDYYDDDAYAEHDAPAEVGPWHTQAFPTCAADSYV